MSNTAIANDRSHRGPVQTLEDFNRATTGEDTRSIVRVVDTVRDQAFLIKAAYVVDEGVIILEIDIEVPLDERDAYYSKQVFG